MGFWLQNVALVKMHRFLGFQAAAGDEFLSDFLLYCCELSAATLCSAGELQRINGK